MTFLQILFLFVSAVILAASIMVVMNRKMIHAALWLILALAGMAVLFVLLEASFLAAVQVVIYIGAIAILIIFAMMLTRRAMHDVGAQVNRNWWLGAVVSVVVFAALMLMLLQVPGMQATAQALPIDESALLVELGSALVDVNMYVLPFEVASVLLLAALIGAIVVARPLSDENEGSEA